jgi:cobyrinic acid a,c-diamide synthase
VEAGLPVYAECGGLMYLARGIRWGDISAEMVGALPVDVELTDRPQGHGYVLAECTGENPFFPAGTVVRGHEFHHSRLTNPDCTLRTALSLERGEGLGDKKDGLVYRNVLACYTHLHASAVPCWASSLVARARQTMVLPALEAKE